MNIRFPFVLFRLLRHSPLLQQSFLLQSFSFLIIDFLLFGLDVHGRDKNISVDISMI